jgi:hypothetical protein
MSVLVYQWVTGGKILTRLCNVATTGSNPSSHTLEEFTLATLAVDG